VYKRIEIPHFWYSSVGFKNIFSFRRSDRDLIVVYGGLCGSVGVIGHDLIWFIFNVGAINFETVD
jgi:hypothetical protein